MDHSFLTFVPDYSLSPKNYPASLFCLRSNNSRNFDYLAPCPTLHHFQVTYVMLQGVAEERQNNHTKSLEGFFFLAGSNVQNYLRVGKRALHHTLKELQSEFHH